MMEILEKKDRTDTCIERSSSYLVESEEILSLKERKKNPKQFNQY